MTITKSPRHPVSNGGHRRKKVPSGFLILNHSFDSGFVSFAQSVLNHDVSDVALNDALLQKIGGWQAVKEARAIHAAGKVLSAEWNPPELRGEVQAASGVLKTGLTIKNAIDVENHCTCRDARQWGRICGHALAVAVEVLNPTPQKAVPSKSAGRDKSHESETETATPKPSAANLLKLATDGIDLKIALVFPTDLAGSNPGAGS